MSLKEFSVNTRTFEDFELLLKVIRICGFCPIEWRKKGSNVVIKRSVFYIVYSYTFATILAALILLAIFEGRIFHIKSTVPTLTHSLVLFTFTLLCIFSVLAGMISSPFYVKDLREFLQALKNCEMLISKTNTREPKRSIVISSVFLSSAFVAIFGNIFASVLSRDKANLLPLLRRMLPVQIPLVLMLIQEVPYWYCSRMIRIQLENLNRSMKLILGPTEKNYGNISLLTYEKVTSFMIFSRHITKSIEAVNRFCGLSVVMTVLDSLSKFVAMTFFLLSHFNARGFSFFVFLEICVALLHCGRLVMLVESCEDCLKEREKSTDLVFKLLTFDTNEKVREQLHLYALQLVEREVHFSPFSLLKMNRPLLTTISGAVTTFLVVLFQFGDRSGA